MVPYSVTMCENAPINWGWFLSWQHNYRQSQVWWQTPVILVLRSWRKANQVFKTNFSYIVKLKQVFGMEEHEMATQKNYLSNLTWPFPRIQALDWGHRVLVFSGWWWDRVYNRNIHRWRLGRKRRLKKRNASRAMHSIPKDAADCKCVSCNIELWEC